MCRERFGRGSEWEPLQRKIAAFLFAVQLAQIDDATETRQGPSVSLLESKVLGVSSFSLPT